MKSLRIGVICEGPTDFHAIRHFMKPALEQGGISATFIDIQPDMGRTLPEAGWGNVEWWFKRNPPEARVRQYFGGGLFQRNLFAKACDLFLIQMDSDILNDNKFRTHLLREYNCDIGDNIPYPERGATIIRILEMWSDIRALTNADVRRHVFAPAVEATEAWCVAAFNNKHPTPEALSGIDLVQAFMEALERSEGQAVKNYTEANKSSDRRDRFCEKHAVGFARILELCPHFRRAVIGVQTAVGAPPDNSNRSRDIATPLVAS